LRVAPLRLGGILAGAQDHTPGGHRRPAVNRPDPRTLLGSAPAQAGRRITTTTFNSKEGIPMKKLLSLLIAATFAAVSFQAVAQGAKKEEKTEMKVEKKAKAKKHVKAKKHAKKVAKKKQVKKEEMKN
jgi:hypothetical protein